MKYFPRLLVKIEDLSSFANSALFNIPILSNSTGGEEYRFSN